MNLQVMAKAGSLKALCVCKVGLRGNGLSIHGDFWHAYCQ
jgi:hypothetical protein